MSRPFRHEDIEQLAADLLDLMLDDANITTVEPYMRTVYANTRTAMIKRIERFLERIEEEFFDQEERLCTCGDHVNDDAGSIWHCILHGRCQIQQCLILVK